MKNTLSALLLAMLIQGGASLCAADPSAAAPLGKIGDEDVSVQDVLPALNGLGEMEITALQRDPVALGKLVRSLVIQRAVLREALAKKWDERPEVIERIRHARETAITDSFLKDAARAAESYPNETELKAAYGERRDQLAMPRTFRLAQIFISDPKGQPKEASTRARERLDRVRELVRAPGSDFATIAREHSEERESASRGGEIGWLTQQQIQPEIFAKLPELKFNVVSEAMRLDDGWHFLKVLDARESFVPTLEQVREDLVRTLRAERTQGGIQDYLSKLLQRNPVVINEIEVSKLLPPVKKTAASVTP